MHCWKTINVQKLYGHDRLFLFSIISVFGVFSVFYILLDFLKRAPLSDHLFGFFLLAFSAIYPLHKLLHFLPLWTVRRHLRFSINRHINWLPTLSMRIHEPILKTRYLISLLTPFIFLNMTIITCALFFPTYRHYFTILLAYHCGLCLIDLLYVKHIHHSPKRALIEETDKGFQILIPLVQNTK